jgi:hypothetical protein
MHTAHTYHPPFRQFETRRREHRDEVRFLLGLRAVGAGHRGRILERLILRLSK